MREGGLVGRVDAGVGIAWVSSKTEGSSRNGRMSEMEEFRTIDWSFRDEAVSQSVGSTCNVIIIIIIDRHE